MYLLIDKNDSRLVYGFNDKKEAKLWNDEEFENEFKLVKIDLTAKEPRGFGFADVYIDITDVSDGDELLTVTYNDIRLNHYMPYYWMDENNLYIAMKDNGDYFIAYGSELGLFDFEEESQDETARREYTGATRL